MSEARERERGIRGDRDDTEIEKETLRDEREGRKEIRKKNKIERERRWRAEEG